MRLDLLSKYKLWSFIIYKSGFTRVHVAEQKKHYVLRTAIVHTSFQTELHVNNKTIHFIQWHRSKKQP